MCLAQLIVICLLIPYLGLCLQPSGKHTGIKKTLNTRGRSFGVPLISIDGLTHTLYGTLKSIHAFLSINGKNTAVSNSCSSLGLRVQRKHNHGFSVFLYQGFSV